MPPDNRISEYLSRSDKWYLGGGKRLTWTPPHPQWLRKPGFWDEAHYYDFPLAPLFTVTLLNEDGREIPLRFQGRRWQPDALTKRYETGVGLALTERQSLTADDVLTSECVLENHSTKSRTVHLLAWTMQDTRTPEGERRVTGADIQDDDHLQFDLRLSKEDRPACEVACALGAGRSPDSQAIILAESGPPHPRWNLSPFYESFQSGRLRDTRRTGEDAKMNGPLYLGLHLQVDIPPDSSETATFGFSAAPESEEAARSLSETLRSSTATPAARSTEAWATYFDQLPDFSCSDPHLEKYYWYRWFGLRLFTAHPDKKTNYDHPAVYEGLGYFRKLITYSAQCHMLETRWMDDPSLAQGSLLNHLDNQRDDGGLYGHLFSHSAQENSFYHANWGHMWPLFQNHPDEDFLEKAYDGLHTYLDYFDRERDPDDSALYDIHNHYETGQEYMHRYVAVSRDADRVHWGRIFRLKGVDAAVQIYETKRAMAKAARRLGRPGEADAWDAGADRTRDAVRREMWDPDTEMFFDLNPETGERTHVKATTCFYPYFTDIVTDEHLPGLKKHLLNPDEFWTPYPAASSSQDDPYFSARPYWKDKRMNCPWNGRVWPMTNSHVAEALAQAAIRFEDDDLREKAAVFMQRYIRMLFDEGDPERPNCFEHYNPMTGKPCRYRGVDDYQHSWIVELIIKYVCGLRPGDDGVVADPFPFDVKQFRIEDIPVRGHHLGVEREGQRFRAFVDGDPAGESELGNPIQLSV